MSVDSRILDKIKKCLALSNSSEPHEAAAGLRQAQKLMAAHNLTLTDVEVGPIDQVPVQSKTSATKCKDWEVTLFDNIAKAFSLLLTFKPGYPYATYSFIGPKGDCQIAIHTLEVLRRQVIKARRKLLDEATESVKAKLQAQYGYQIKLSGPTKRRLTNNCDSWAMGWVVAATQQVDKLYRPEAQTAAIANRHAELTGGRKAEAQNRKLDQAIAAQGYREGKKVELRRAMHTEQQEALAHGPA